MNRLQGHVLVLVCFAFALSASTASAEIKILDGDSGREVDSITKGRCNVGGEKGNRQFFLYAKSTQNKFRLTAFISSPVFDGFGERYDVFYGGEDPQIFLTRLADDEAFSNFKLPGTPSGEVWAGGIAFRNKGTRVGIGLYGASNKSATEGYSFAGPINCKYKRR